MVGDSTPVRAWNTALNILLYPSAWLHEQTHYLVLQPYVKDASHEYSATDSSATLTVAVGEIPRWRYVLGALAPTLLGLLCGVTAALVSVSGLAPARGSLVGWLILGTYWFLYTVPSVADLTAAVDAVSTARGEGG
jgi:hypothetical protein